MPAAELKRRFKEGRHTPQSPASATSARTPCAIAQDARGPWSREHEAGPGAHGSGRSGSLSGTSTSRSSGSLLRSAARPRRFGRPPEATACRPTQPGAPRSVEATGEASAPSPTPSPPLPRRLDRARRRTTCLGPAARAAAVTRREARRGAARLTPRVLDVLSLRQLPPAYEPTREPVVRTAASATSTVWSA